MTPQEIKHKQRDNTDLFCVGPSSTTTGEDLAADFQSALDRWSGGLRATGGALAPIKPFY